MHQEFPYHKTFIDKILKGIFMEKNRLKEKLKRGEAAFGVFIWEPAFQLIEILGLLGFDYLYIDCQHSPMSVETVTQIVRTAELRGLTPYVRVPQNVPEIILRYLDAGVMGIHVADMDSAEVARKAVRAVKYPPEGERGLASTRAADFGLADSMAEYIKKANLETMVMGTVESKEGVDNIREILNTEGLDGVSIGLADLSKSLGVPGQRNHPLVLQAVDKVLAAGKETRKPIGVMVAGDETPKQYVEKGFRMVSKSLTALVISAGKQFLQNARTLPSPKL
jgi:2-keto-3-deoxy-L-rhamnonate aldolase RhmA